MQFKIYLMDKPQPKQSARFTKSGFSFKPANVLKSEQNLKAQIRTELEKQFKDWDIVNKVLEVDYAFIYPFKSEYLASDKVSLKKKLAERINKECGEWNDILLPFEGVSISEYDAVILKPTTPDIDNLMKGVNDAMQSVVMQNDSTICTGSFIKGYGHKAGIHVWIRIIEDKDAIRFIQDFDSRLYIRRTKDGKKS